MGLWLIKRLPSTFGAPVIPGYGHVSMVFVHPDMWGRGVGRGLLQGLHERALAKGWRRTTLGTRTSNQRAHRLYEGQGYRASGARDHAWRW